MSQMDDQQLLRYSRQIMLPEVEVNMAGQDKLDRVTIARIGEAV